MSANFTDGRIPTSGPPTWETPLSFTVPYQPIPGMTLRDWFAGQALASMIALNDRSMGPHAFIAKKAYAIADAMLAARAAGAPEKEG